VTLGGPTSSPYPLYKEPPWGSPHSSPIVLSPSPLPSRVFLKFGTRMGVGTSAPYIRYRASGTSVRIIFFCCFARPEPGRRLYTVPVQNYRGATLGVLQRLYFFMTLRSMNTFINSVHRERNAFGLQGYEHRIPPLLCISIE
jgi:hypothetical protein